mmetsp:Transcript_4583/g.3851  ORF Transcript_4583/g.3851 Transcript_4583/m.3851 type:complete len:289 (+) Transcript_4583:396-1262(+)
MDKCFHVQKLTFKDCTFVGLDDSIVFEQTSNSKLRQLSFFDCFKTDLNELKYILNAMAKTKLKNSKLELIVDKVDLLSIERKDKIYEYEIHKSSFIRDNSKLSYITSRLDTGIKTKKNEIKGMDLETKKQHGFYKNTSGKSVNIAVYNQDQVDGYYRMTDGYNNKYEQYYGFGRKDSYGYNSKNRLHGLCYSNSKYELYLNGELSKEFKGSQIDMLLEGDQFWLKYVNRLDKKRLLILPQRVDGEDPIEIKILEREMKARVKLMKLLNRKVVWKGTFCASLITLRGQK